jgi:hypothetical protein
VKSILSRRTVLTAGLACFVAAGLPVGAADGPAGKRHLKSAYSPQVFVDWARQVHLTVEFDDKGNGSGTLTFDPNIHREFSSTCIAPREIRVRLRAIQDDHHAAKGRRLYEVHELRLEGQVGPNVGKWLLTVPTNKGAACSLTFLDTDGKVKDVVMLE